MKVHAPFRFFLLFLLLAALVLFAAGSESSLLMYLSKPLAVPALAIFFWLKTRPMEKAAHLPPRSRFYALAALFFSTMGDVLLMLENEHANAGYFIPGLTAFLCAHLFYLGAFKELRTGAPFRFETISLAPLLYLAWMWYILLPALPSALLLPVILYSTALILVLLTVLSLHRHLPVPAFRTLLTGALLFVLSDSLLAGFRFGILPRLLPWAKLLVLATYLSAQGFLVWGLILAGRRSENRSIGSKPT